MSVQAIETMMNVREATREDVSFICNHLRELNAREAFALRFHNDPSALVEEIAAIEPFCIKHYCFCQDGEPVALVGAWIMGPRRAALAMRATSRLTIGWSVYRFIKTVFVPAVLAPNVNIAETDALADGPSRQWLARLGCVETYPPLPRGKNGELFVTVAWINPEPTHG